MWYKLSKFLFPSLYWKGRGEGWKSCEDMIFSRIETYYPNQKEELINRIIQMDLNKLD